MTRVWTAVDVERISGGELREIVLHPGDLISPSARDIAESRGLVVRRTVARASDDEHADCGCSAEHDCGCGGRGSRDPGAAALVVDDQVVAQVRELARTIAAANPGASAADVARETMSALGANGSPGVGTPDAAQPLPGHRFPVKGKGARPSYHADPGVDAVISIVMTLASEVWVLRERVMTLESLLVDKRVIDHDSVDRHYATGADAEGRLAAAGAYVSRLLRVFAEWREEIRGDESEGAYHEIIRRAFSQVKGNS